MNCKTWTVIAERYFNPLCTNRFYPESSSHSCPICVKPKQVTAPPDPDTPGGPSDPDTPP
jgi:hypothetical protein